eukprot:8525608-Alexandrium_andersonii.AAC.1
MKNWRLRRPPCGSAHCGRLSGPPSCTPSDGLGFWSCRDPPGAPRVALSPRTSCHRRIAVSQFESGP